MAVGTTYELSRGDSFIKPILYTPIEGAIYRVQMRDSADATSYFVLEISNGNIIATTAQTSQLTAGTWYVEVEENNAGVVTTIEIDTVIVSIDVVRTGEMPQSTIEDSVEVAEMISKEMYLRNPDNSLIDVRDTLGNLESDKVPYSGANQNTDLGDYGIKSAYHDYNTAVEARATLLAGQSEHSGGDYKFGMNGGQVVGTLFEENYIKSKNTQGTEGVDGRLIMATGSDGNSGVINSSDANPATHPRYIMAVRTEPIANNTTGYNTWFGKVSGIKTNGADVGEAWVDGTILYQHPSVAGKFTSIRPTFGNKVEYAIVLNAHATNGHLFVRIQRSVEMNDINDANVTETNQPIVRDASGHIVSKKDGLEIDSITPSSGTLDINGDTTSTNHQSEIITASVKVETPLVDATEVQSTNGFKKDGLTNASILLASGGDKLISDFQAYLLSNDINADASSISKYPSVKAIKDYCDSLVVGLLDWRGGFNASVNTYPISGGSGSGGAILKGDMWIVTVEGVINGEKVLVGSSLIANIDSPAQLDANWTRIVSGLSYIPEDEANKSTDINADSLSDVKYPSVNAVVDYAEKLSNKSTDVSTDGSSDVKYPTTKATKTYSDTKIAKTDIETVRSQSTTKVPASKLLDDQLNLKVDLAGGNTIAGENVFTNPPSVTDDLSATSNELASVNKVASMIVGSEPASRAVLQPELAYYTRVLADAGAIFDNQVMEWLAQNEQNLINESLFYWDGVLGTKHSGGKASKIYSMSSTNNDASQATSANQPYVAGTIAPNESLKLKCNQNTTLNHIDIENQISFISTDKWSVCFGAKINLKGDCTILSDTYNNNTIFINSNLGIEIYNGSSFTFSNGTIENSEIGKLIFFNIVYDGQSTLSLYKNGIYKQSISFNSAFTFKYILRGLFGAAGLNLNGELNHASIIPRALSASEIQASHTYLRTLHPEIEGIDIGNQHWATSNYEGTVASDGSVIAEMQDATNITLNVSTCVNSGVNPFTSFSGASTTGFSAVSNGSGLQIAGTADEMTIVSGKWYKIAFDLTLNSGTAPNFGLADTFGGLGFQSPNNLSVNGSNSVYVKAINGGTGLLQFYVIDTATDFVVSNLAVQSLGWSDSTNLYTYLTGTLGYTPYQAYKECGWWCHYDNSADNGAIYGKLYNWYAVALLALYPPQGWRVPTSADMYQLQTYLGGSTVAGGKMKKDGLNYWNTPNTGATNESGFTGLGCGDRAPITSFANLNVYLFLWAANESSSTNANTIHIHSVDTLADVSNYSKVFGFSLRLLRNEPVGENEIMLTTGRFSTDISASPKLVAIPFGYNVESIVVKSSNTLSAISAFVFDGAYTSIGTICSSVPITANQPLIIRNVNNIKLLQQDGYVCIYADGNTGDGMVVDVVLKKVQL